MANASTESDGLHQNVTSIPLPAKLDFAGEPVPLHRQDIKEALERELTIQSFLHSRTSLALKRLGRWNKPLKNILKNEHVPEDFLYLAIAESLLDNRALSPKDAMGMWQMLEEPARKHGLEVSSDVDERRDPFKATKAAASYLKEAHGKLGQNWTLAAASYNRGMTGMQNALKEQGTDSYYDLFLNPETARYIYRILAFKVILESPETYGYNIPPSERYSPWKFKEVTLDSTAFMPSYAQKLGLSYKTLREYNPWLNDYSTYMLKCSKEKPRSMRVPN